MVKLTPKLERLDSLKGRLSLQYQPNIHEDPSIIHSYSLLEQITNGGPKHDKYRTVQVTTANAKGFHKQIGAGRIEKNLAYGLLIRSPSHITDPTFLEHFKPKKIHEITTLVGGGLSDEKSAFLTLEYYRQIIQDSAQQVLRSTKQEGAHRKSISRLIEAYKKSKTIEEIIERGNIPLAIKNSIYFHKTHPLEERDTLDSEAIIYLFNAIRGFDITRGLRFSTYATSAIKKGLKNFIDKKNSRPMLQLEAEGNLEKPSKNSIIQTIESQLDSIQQICIDQPSLLNDRERKILYWRLFSGKTLEETGKIVGQEFNPDKLSSKERIRQIQKKVFKKLKGAFEEKFE